MKRQAEYIIIVTLDKVLAKSVPGLELLVTDATNVGRVLHVLGLDVFDHVALVLAGVAADLAGPESAAPLHQPDNLLIPGDGLCNRFGFIHKFVWAIDIDKLFYLSIEYIDGHRKLKIG